MPATAASATKGSAVLSAIWFLLLGGLLAANAPLSLGVTMHSPRSLVSATDT